MDFSQDELIEAIERLINGLLERAGITAPPVDALTLAEDHLGIPVTVFERAEDDGRRRRPRLRPAGAGIAVSSGMTDAEKNKAAADGIARSLVPQVLNKLGLSPNDSSRQLASHIVGIASPRILVPTRLLKAAIRECKWDLLVLHERFSTAAVESIGLRMLDLDEPCFISIVDDGIVAIRRGNRGQPGKTLLAPEQVCHDRVAELELPHRVRAEGWTVNGWPVTGRVFRRIIIRSVPDDDV